MKYFLTVGTQPHQFKRLVDYALNTVDHDDIVLQLGKTKYETDAHHFDFTQDFDTYLEACDVVITHGGVGSIISALLNDKKVIAVARKHDLNEHVDNHQFEIVNKLAKENYILKADTIEEFQKCIDTIDSHQFKKYKKNQKNFNQQLIKELNV